MQEKQFLNLLYGSRFCLPTQILTVWVHFNNLIFFFFTHQQCSQLFWQLLSIIIMIEFFFFFFESTIVFHFILCLGFSSQLEFLQYLAFWFHSALSFHLSYLIPIYSNLRITLSENIYQITDSFGFSKCHFFLLTSHRTYLPYCNIE